MELTPLRYLSAIAEADTMTAAAERLGVAQPTLSAAVRRLEEELGVELFSRTGRGLEPTEACRVFLEHASDALRGIDAGVRAVRALAGLEAGTVRVGGGATAVTYLLPRVVERFRREHPRLHVNIREAGSAHVAESVLRGDLDLAIVTPPVTLPGGDELMTVATGRDELRLVAPPGHPLADRATFRWDALAGEPVVGFDAGSSVRLAIDEAAASRGVSLDVVVELRSIQGIRRMVQAGVGCGFVSSLALEEGEGLACEHGALARELAVVRRRDRVPSPAAVAFEAVLAASLAEQ
ncbi:MAG: LysR substrate-binding domain-containing protein [Planctomycetota bacterium]